jgi:integrase
VGIQSPVLRSCCRSSYSETAQSSVTSTWTSEVTPSFSSGEYAHRSTPASLEIQVGVRRREVPIWDTEQLALFLGTARRDHPARYPLLHFTIGTGLAMGEGLGLRWQDLDWIQHTATIRQTFGRLGGRQLWKPPKTDSRGRPVRLGPQVLESVREVQRT